MSRGREKGGFTLVEIMIVVVIIGILATLSVSAYLSTRRRSQATIIANDLRTFAAAFEVYALEIGTWPSDVGPGTVPPGMQGRISKFTEPTVIGGNFDWDYNTHGITAGVAVYNPTTTPDVIQKIDEVMDDGNLTTGRITGNISRIVYILEP